jgi:hypothetical protein
MRRFLEKSPRTPQRGVSHQKEMRCLAADCDLPNTPVAVRRSLGRPERALSRREVAYTAPEYTRAGLLAKYGRSSVRSTTYRSPHEPSYIVGCASKIHDITCNSSWLQIGGSVKSFRTMTSATLYCIELSLSDLADLVGKHPTGTKLGGSIESRPPSCSKCLLGAACGRDWRKNSSAS